MDCLAFMQELELIRSFGLIDCLYCFEEHLLRVPVFLDVLSDFFVIPEESDGSRDEDDRGKPILPYAIIEATEDEANDGGEEVPDDPYDNSER